MEELVKIKILDPEKENEHAKRLRSLYQSGQVELNKDQLSVIEKIINTQERIQENAKLYAAVRFSLTGEKQEVKEQEGTKVFNQKNSFFRNGLKKIKTRIGKLTDSKKGNMSMKEKSQKSKLDSDIERSTRL